MDILILGATSEIGSALAIKFAAQNNLILLGRNKNKLEKLRNACLDNHAHNVQLITRDIASELDEIKNDLTNVVIDIVINAASATSQLRDPDIIFGQVENYFAVDVISPLRIIQHCLKVNNKLEIIFISTILAMVKSPDRNLYAALKVVEEIFLQKLQKEYPLIANILIIKVGKVIKTDKASKQSQQLASKVYQAYISRKKSIIYGLTGYIYLFLFYLQPILFFIIVKIQRLLRNKAE